MFQLIVAVVAIVLIAVMVIASLWWGGYIFTDSKVRAEYAQNMNSAAQIEGAMQMYFNDNARDAPGQDMELLNHLFSTGYLKEIPKGAGGDHEWKVSKETLYRPIDSLEYCSTMNRVAGFDVTLADVAAEPWAGCPPCNGEGATLTLANKYKNWPGCQMVEETSDP